MSITESLQNLLHNIAVLSNSRIHQIQNPPQGSAAQRRPTPPQQPAYAPPDASCAPTPPRPSQASPDGAQQGLFETTLSVLLSQQFELWIKSKRIVSGALFCNLDEADCKALRTLLNSVLRPSTPELGPDGKPVKVGLREMMGAVDLRTAAEAKTEQATTAAPPVG